MNKNDKPTLKDIAQELNISIVTASNALAGRKGVSDDMRRAVKETAVRMGYSGKSFNKDELESKKIGVIVLDSYLSKYTSFYWEMYQKIASEASRKTCFTVLELLSYEKTKNLILPKMVQDGIIDGLIVLGKFPTAYLKIIYKSTEKPILFMDFNEVELPSDAVLSNNYFGMYKMTNYLISKGHTRIGFIGNILATESIMDRYMGYVRAMMEHKLEINKKWLLNDRDDKIGKVIIKLPENIEDDMPTAFVCNSDYTANQLFNKLRKIGYEVPRDISLVGYDDFLSTGEMKDKITTYAVDLSAMANRAIKMLLKKMANYEGEKQVRIIDGKMIIRDSVKNII